MQLVQKDIHQLLGAVGVDSLSSFWLRDRPYYRIPRSTVAWLSRHWVKSLPPELKDNRGSVLLPKWVENAWDCDNHANDFADYVCRSNVLTQTKQKAKRGGIALGPFYYRSEGSSGGRLGGHVLNIFIDENEEVTFWEPGDQQFVRLTRSEIESCIGGEFR